MEHFNFADEKVLNTLLKAKTNGTEYLGSATSDFQSHPYVSEKNNNSKPRTDWEIHVHRMVQKKKHKILGPQNISEFPRFFERKEQYIDRCAELGENMFRTSFDFGRLCPGEG